MHPRRIKRMDGGGEAGRGTGESERGEHTRWTLWAVFGLQPTSTGRTSTRNAPPPRSYLLR